MTINRFEILSSEKLPSVPGVALKVVELARNPDASVGDMVPVIKSDPALVAKILRAANSAVLGLRRNVSSIEQAVLLLGTSPLSNLVLTFSLLPKSTQQGPFAAHFQAYWRSSLTQAVAASELSKLRGGGTPADFFVAGLLQDIGRLALLNTKPEEYLSVQDESQLTGRPLVELEQERLGFTHAEISGVLCQRWGLAQNIQQAVVEHHGSVSSLDQADGKQETSLRIALSTAAAIAEYFESSDKTNAWELLETLARRFYSLEGENLHTFLERVSSRMHEMADQFSLEVGQCPSYDEILAVAREQLVSLTKKAQCDPSTGLMQQISFDRCLIDQWSQATENGDSLALMLVEIDDYDQIQETWGSLLAQKVLVGVAHGLRSVLGKSIPVARYDSCRFAALWQGASEEETLIAAEACRLVTAAHTESDQSHRVEVTGSIGLSHCRPFADHTVQWRDLLRSAESAVKEAKGAGGNQVLVKPLSMEVARKRAK